MKRNIFTLLLLCSVTVVALGHSRQLFDDNWCFILADSAHMEQLRYDDTAWRRLSLPHDWAIEGDFSAGNPSGASGGALPGGIGWYRKHFTQKHVDKAAKYYIDFDGVYMNATVYVNGQKVGHRPYGFSSFRVDITKALRQGQNVVAVKVDNSRQPNSRWYSGCGIYRHVYFVEKPLVHVSQWGQHVKSHTRGFDMDIAIDNETKAARKLRLRSRVIDASGRQVATDVRAITVAPGTSTFAQRLTIRHPRRWDITSPYLYTVTTELLEGDKIVDEERTKAGIRTFRFDAKTGFWLNGKPVKINGVCDHHDMGCLGAAVYKDAIVRKITLLQQMGCNAIRTSHNPPAPELLDVCDSLGMLVMDEAFDMWQRKKTTYDYSLYFDEWAERDLTDMVRRDRNHPSIVMWSIGNEVLEQWDEASADTLTAEQANLVLNAGHKVASGQSKKLSQGERLTHWLTEIVRRHDDSRPITAGCNEPSPDNRLFRSGALDLIGFNYHHEDVKNVPIHFPGKPFLMTESVSALQTRGYYMMPSDSVFVAPKAWWLPYTDPTFMCSAYDNMHASWSSTHEATWDVVKHTPYCAGQFIWTGWDYIGEPTPYGFPARSSYFGIIDLAGFPKDVYYMYQSEWTDKNVLHLFPHWNWLPGQMVDMWCYYNKADEVELFVNGVSQGKRSKQPHQYHVMWRVSYEAGNVKVVARKDGKVVGEQTIHTAGQPDHLRLSASVDTLSSEGKRLSFVTVEVVDKDGRLCPWAENQISFEIAGEGKIIGVDNGCPFSMERFKDTKRKAFFGKALCVVEAGRQTGEIKLRARTVDLKDGELRIAVR